MNVCSLVLKEEHSAGNGEKRKMKIFKGCQLTIVPFGQVRLEIGKPIPAVEERQSIPTTDGNNCSDSLGNGKMLS